MIILRSLLFNFIFYAWATIFLTFHIPYLFGTRERSMIVLQRWATHARRLMNIFIGLYYRVEGLEYAQGRPIIIAAKHQSAWDTFIYPDFIKDPALVVKKELTLIPLYGHFIKKFELIAVDRKSGGSGLKDMVRQAKKVCFEQNRPLVIFPEGTRSTPGEQSEYHPGVAALYSQLKIPVVPVAVNSGVFWGRRSFLKKPGTIVIKFLPPIQPGLKREDFMEKLETTIETESTKLLNLTKKEGSYEKQKS